MVIWPITVVGQMRVVIVENDESLRRAVAQVLRRAGMVIVAEHSNGVDALKNLRLVHPDVILTDCDMPGGNGIDLVRELRANGDQTPVVMLSAHSDESAVARATAAGVNRYLIKPISAESLTMAVREASYNVAA